MSRLNATKLFFNAAVIGFAFMWIYRFFIAQKRSHDGGGGDEKPLREEVKNLIPEQRPEKDGISNLGGMIFLFIKTFHEEN